MTIKHGKSIITHTYYDGAITLTEEEFELDEFTDKQSILKQMIEALSVLNSGESSKLTLVIRVDSRGRYRLVKRWTI